MKIDEVLNFYGNAYKFGKKTGICMQNVSYWKRMGYIPNNMQLRIQSITKKKLIAEYVEMPHDQRGKKRKEPEKTKRKKTVK